MRIIFILRCENTSKSNFVQGFGRSILILQEDDCVCLAYEEEGVGDGALRCGVRLCTPSVNEHIEVALP